VFVAAFYILFSPQILYGFLTVPLIKNELPEQVNMDQTPEKSPAEVADGIATSAKTYLNQNEVAGIIEKIEQIMVQGKPFLNKGYTIHNLGADIHVPVYQLSPVINNHFNANFSTWLNKYRVNYFIELCQTMEMRGLTFDALSFESGFSNRVSFINAFKKEKGITPGAILKDQANT
jgi:AraC-like DNA-binding protein